MKKLFFLLIFLPGLTIAHSQAGTLDPSIAGKGWTTIDFVKGNVVSEIGREVLIQNNGKYIIVFEVNGYTLLARYQSNGMLDNSFGIDGYSEAVKLIQPKAVLLNNGKIVVAGYIYSDIYLITDFALARFNIDGSLDETFDGDGKVITDLSGYHDIISSLVPQSDGKIVVAGWSYPPTSNSFDFALARYNSDGSLDNTFGGYGFVTLDFGGYETAYAVAIQSNGKIVVAGVANENFALARFNSDGTLDNTFDGDGKLNMDLGSFEGAYALTIQNNGKLVIAGYAFNTSTGNNDFALARYNNDGSMDNTFDGDGIVTTDFFGYDEIINSIALQSDGKILAIGSTFNASSFNSDFVLTRYNSNGSLDNTFDGNGIVTTDFGNQDSPNSLLVQSDGKIVVAGHNYDLITENSDLALARYNSNGSLDNTLDEDGKLLSFYSIGISSINDIALQSNGNIVVAGQAFTLNGNYDFALARFKTDGTLDNTFDGDGIVTTDFGNQDNITSLVLQIDGKIVIAGQTLNPNTGNNDFALARYNSNGSLDNTFDGDGIVITDFFGYDEIATSIALQSDGKIVVTGQTFNLNNSSFDFALARYNSNGSLDNTFNKVGKLTTDFGDNDNATSIALQSDGKIVVAGTVVNTNILNNDFALARYNSNGFLDHSFSKDGKLTTDFGSNDNATSIVIQSDGQIIVAGLALNNSTGKRDIALARFNRNGSLDNTFNLDGMLTTSFGDNDNATSLYIYNNKLFVVGTTNIISQRGLIAAYLLDCTPQTFYRDKDSDGFGDATKTKVACSAPNGYVADNTDCNDNNASIHPGATEIYGNNIDDNCDGKIDEQAFVQKLSVNAHPNPSAHSFTLVIQSKGNQPVTIRVLDIATGRVIETKGGIAANASVQIGSNYQPGVYYAEIVQGSEKTLIRLVKRPE